MKKIFVFLICVMLTGCIFGKGKTVTIKDTSTGASVTVQEDGFVVSGDIKINETTTLSIKEDAPEE